MTCLGRFPKRIRYFTTNIPQRLSVGSGTETSKSEFQTRQSLGLEESRSAYLTPIQEMLSLRDKVTVVTG
jgi:hypothetical protein